jgi:5-methylcytosine-specific restriction endonuclease McrA
MRGVLYGDGHFAAEDPKNIPERVRQAVLDRDNCQCQACGTSGENRLQLHHVEYRSQGGGHYEFNLVTLCFRCHNDVHEDRLYVELMEVWEGEWFAFCQRKTLFQRVRWVT